MQILNYCPKILDDSVFWTCSYFWWWITWDIFSKLFGFKHNVMHPIKLIVFQKIISLLQTLPSLKTPIWSANHSRSDQKTTPRSTTRRWDHCTMPGSSITTRYPVCRRMWGVWEIAWQRGRWGWIWRGSLNSNHSLRY